MYDVLVKVIVAAALLQLGISLSKQDDCRSRQCLAKIQAASLEVLKIDWKPISVFPEEAKRFK